MGSKARVVDRPVRGTGVAIVTSWTLDDRLRSYNYLVRLSILQGDSTPLPRLIPQSHGKLGEVEPAR